MRERYPDLTEQEALDRVDEELRGLRARSDELESELDGLRMYGDVSRLGPDGIATHDRRGACVRTPIDTQRGVDWQMRRDARCKLCKSVYPKILM